MQAEQETAPASAPVHLEVAAATFSDVGAAVRAGLRDFGRRPLLSLFFGLVYALFGAALIAGLAANNQIWIVIAAAVGFPLVAPFLAAGLYEMSRRLKRDEPFTASDIFGAIFSQQRREFGWMSFVVLFVFWIWAYQVRLVLALTMSSQAVHSLDRFLGALFTTSEGLTFLAVGTVVGAVLATILFSITVIAMPLLLDKRVDVVTAMITSVKSVLQSPAVMLGWGAMVGALTLVAIAPLFIGVIVIFPVLGHASWHLYERLVSEQ
ncbi:MULTISPECIES: DUF2189 domain-containing protein [unclassified Minwuia]|uniref:DUF2189 domain-containing protein n=1 Tax=unclassified Minwuia TaxID=2618799 RepID=UPI00247ADB33|nr:MULTISPECIES: DUF2189 domain-containing protein [unclassified Minwuia]